MIARLSGKIAAKMPNAVILDVHGIGFEIGIPAETARTLRPKGKTATLFIATHVSRDAIALYGFATEQERMLFQAFVSINGVGPKAAMKVLNVTKPDALVSAINDGRADLLVKAVGVGRKKAQRIVLELRDRFHAAHNRNLAALMESRHELTRALKALGYKEKEIKAAIQKIPAAAATVQDQLKAALKWLSR